MVDRASRNIVKKAATTVRPKSQSVRNREARIHDEAVEAAVGEAIEAAVLVMAPVVAIEAPAAGKQKLVRDSFTMPKDEYEALDALKKRLFEASRSVKKGELLRAGVRALTLMGDAELVAAVARIPNLKTGRPKNAKASNGKSSKGH